MEILDEFDHVDDIRIKGTNARALNINGTNSPVCTVYETSKLHEDFLNFLYAKIV